MVEKTYRQMAKKLESIKHKTDTRSLVPSKEEAGYEDVNAKVQDSWTNRLIQGDSHLVNLYC